MSDQTNGTTPKTKEELEASGFIPPHKRKAHTKQVHERRTWRQYKKPKKVKPPKTPDQLEYQHKMHMAARVTKRRQERKDLLEKQKIQMATLMARHREEQDAERK